MKFFFYAEIQRKFIYSTSEASSVIEFHVLDDFHQHATYCHSNQHCGSSLSVFWEKIWENSAKKKLQ